MILIGLSAFVGYVVAGLFIVEWAVRYSTVLDVPDDWRCRLGLLVLGWPALVISLAVIWSLQVLGDLVRP